MFSLALYKLLEQTNGSQSDCLYVTRVLDTIRPVQFLDHLAEEKKMGGAIASRYQFTQLNSPIIVQNKSLRGNHNFLFVIKKFN